MNIKVISSSKMVYEANEVLEVNAPGIEGRIGLLPNHINIITPLTIGVLKIKFVDRADEIMLNGGMLQLAGKDILILADEANLAKELVKDEIAQAIKMAEQHIASSEVNPTELIQLEKKLRYEKFKEQQLN